MLGEVKMRKERLLKKYIMESELRIFSKNIRVRLNKELSVKYDKSCYKVGLDNMQECFDMLRALNIKFPSSVNHILYIYILPMDKCSELLEEETAIGRTVNCFDLDGFRLAYGLREDLLEKINIKNIISEKVNKIHELTHVLHNEYDQSNRLIHEGFAEAVPLYVMGLEKEFTEYKEVLSHLTFDNIYTAQELLNQEYNKTFGKEEAVPNNTWSFRLSYISSYLFVRGCLETIEKFKNCSKEKAAQKFLEILRSIRCLNEWLIFDIANALGLDKNILLYSKDLQIKVLNEIINE